MLRKLLACLALLTGLAAAGAPARAEVAVAMASRIEAIESGVTAARGQAETVVARPLSNGRAAIANVAWLSMDRLSASPTVQLRSDRARE